MSWDGEDRRSTDRTVVELTKINGKLDTVLNEVTNLDRTINGSNGTPGLRMEVDRLKQSKSRQDWFHGVTATALIGAVVSWFMGK